MSFMLGGMAHILLFLVQLCVGVASEAFRHVS